jgi:hypothetical protein
MLLNGLAVSNRNGTSTLRIFSRTEPIAAADLAGRQRIWPAVRGISGLVGLSVLRAPDLGTIVIIGATSAEALEAAQRAELGTELMPGPDRVEIHHVTGSLAGLTVGSTAVHPV